MQKSNTDDYYRDICKNFMNVDISENDKDFISIDYDSWIGKRNSR